MNYILSGVAGFLLLHLLDFASLKNNTLAKPALWLCGSILVIWSSIMVAVTGQKLPLPAWLTVCGWLLLAVSAGGMIYSLYIALPFTRTYFKAGVPDRLVVNGLYRLVRHPWLVFFALAMAGLTLGSRSILSIAAGAAWTGISFTLVYFQDKKVFPRMFPGYGEYQKTTPMFWPNRHSLTAFTRGLRQNKVPEV